MNDAPVALVVVSQKPQQRHEDLRWSFYNLSYIKHHWSYTLKVQNPYQREAREDKEEGGEGKGRKARGMEDEERKRCWDEGGDGEKLEGGEEESRRGGSIDSLSEVSPTT